MARRANRRHTCPSLAAAPRHLCPYSVKRNRGPSPLYNGKVELLA